MSDSSDISEMDFGGQQGSLSASDREAIQKICQSIAQKTGVQLGERQLPMVRSRLAKRMSDLSIVQFSDYWDHLQKNPEEQITLIGILTTHHTYFFREFSHFEFLETQFVPEWVALKRKTPLRVWSAACSRGQEVYSLAMWLKHIRAKRGESWSFEIFGTDVDPQSVEIGKKGVYLWNEIKEIPLKLLQGNWARGTGEISEYARVQPQLKNFTRFGVHNLLEPVPTNFGKWDLIFCRNVFIYFTPEQVKKITEGFTQALDAESGHLVVGVSESLKSLELPLEAVATSVYLPKSRVQAKIAAAKAAASTTKKSPEVALPVMAPVQAKLRVLLVDDSPVIHTLLGKILDSSHGFEVVGNAKNGLEAIELSKKLAYDIMTLDLHMPECDGIQYLERNFKAGHPPVVICSSAAREDQEWAGKALKLGARDFIQKPTFSNLDAQAEEIRTKLKIAAGSQATKKVESQKDLAAPKAASWIDSTSGSRKQTVVVFGDESDLKRFCALPLHQSRAREMDITLVSSKSGLKVSDFLGGKLKLATLVPSMPAHAAGSEQFWIVMKGFPSAQLEAANRYQGIRWLEEEAAATLSRATVHDRQPFTSFNYILARWLDEQKQAEAVRKKAVA